MKYVILNILFMMNVYSFYDLRILFCNKDNIVVIKIPVTFKWQDKKQQKQYFNRTN